MKIEQKIQLEEHIVALIAAVRKLRIMLNTLGNDFFDDMTIRNNGELLKFYAAEAKIKKDMAADYAMQTEHIANELYKQIINE